MMPADLIYALSTEQQRTALNTARQQRLAARQAADTLARERKETARTQRRTLALPRLRRWVRLRPSRECAP